LPGTVYGGGGGKGRGVKSYPKCGGGYESTSQKKGKKASGRDREGSWHCLSSVKTEDEWGWGGELGSRTPGWGKAMPEKSQEYFVTKPELTRQGGGKKKKAKLEGSVVKKQRSPTRSRGSAKK